MNQAIILAGGKGTRLSSRLRDLPKPLINFCGQPLLLHQLNLLKTHGYKEVLILACYQSDKIANFIENLNDIEMHIEVIEEAKPLGTSGALLASFSKLDNTFLVMYGDTMLDVNLQRFYDFHKSSGTDISLFIHPNDHPHDSDIVEIDERNKIIDFHPYPHCHESKYYRRNLVNAALYMINRDCLKDHAEQKIAFSDFGKDLFPQLLGSGTKISGYNSPEYIKDCGTPDRLDAAIKDFRSGKIQNSNLNIPQSAIFIDRDGTLNKEVGHLSCVEDLELIRGAEKAINLVNKSNFKAIVVTNQPVIARGECTIDELNNIHNKLETLLGHRSSYIDRISFCPHHPDSGFKNEVKSLKGPCNCRKPNTGMLEKAKCELNIDFSRSWFIGDSTADIKTAENCGMKSILVKTGEAGKDGKYEINPDFVMEDVLSAVEYILKNS